MGKDQIGATALHVEVRAQQVERDRGALHMPARPAAAERRLPGRFAGARQAPDHTIQWGFLASSPWVAASLGEKRDSRSLIEMRQGAELRVTRLGKVQIGELRIVDRVDLSSLLKLLDHCCDERNGLDRTHVVLRRQDI